MSAFSVWPASGCEKLCFAHDDRLHQAVCKAQDAMYALRIYLHYASCERGVCEPPDPECFFPSLVDAPPPGSGRLEPLATRFAGSCIEAHLRD